MILCKEWPVGAPQKRRKNQLGTEDKECTIVSQAVMHARDKLQHEHHEKQHEIRFVVRFKPLN